ncbi:unnamed protein product [Ixodes persulcatus]
MACSLGQLLSLLDAAAAKPGLMPQDSRAESASAEWIPSHHGLTHDTAVTSAAATVPGPAVRAAAVAPGDGREMRPPPVPPRGPMCTNSTYASHLLAPCSSPSPSLSSRPLAQERGNSSSASTVEELHCSMTLLERLIRTSSIWFLPDIGRSGAVHYLQGKEVGNFIVRQSSKKGTLALSVRLPLEVGPYIEHYLIETTPEGKHRLEGSDNHFASVPVLICHYCQCCDELPVRLGLPSVLMQPSTRQELSAFSLLGQGRMCSSLLLQNIGCLRASTGHFLAFVTPCANDNCKLVFQTDGCIFRSKPTILASASKPAIKEHGTSRDIQRARYLPATSSASPGPSVPKLRAPTLVGIMRAMTTPRPTTSLRASRSSVHFSENTLGKTPGFNRLYTFGQFTLCSTLGLLINAPSSQKCSPHEQSPFTGAKTRRESPPKTVSKVTILRHTHVEWQDHRTDETMDERMPAVVEKNEHITTILRDSLSKGQTLISERKEGIGIEEAYAHSNCCAQKGIPAQLCDIKCHFERSASLGENDIESSACLVICTSECTSHIVAPLSGGQCHHDIPPKLYNQNSGGFGYRLVQFKTCFSCIFQLNTDFSEVLLLPTSLRSKGTSSRILFPYPFKGILQRNLKYSRLQQCRDRIVYSSACGYPRFATDGAAARRKKKISVVGGNQENRKTKGCPGKESVKLEAHDSIVENTKPHRKKCVKLFFIFIFSVEFPQVEDSRMSTDSVETAASVTSEDGASDVLLSECPTLAVGGNRSSGFQECLRMLLASRRIGGHYKKDSTVGVNVRSYIFKLVQERNTTFAMTIENFIQCTRESNETSPTVVMRNIRQFMSGMKNYLLKHGEGQFEQLVQEEQSKLKSDEFMNIDAIIEVSLHRLVIKPLRRYLYQLFVNHYTKSGSLKLLSDNIKYARTKSPQDLGIRTEFEPPRGVSLELVQYFLQKLQKSYSPLRKLENLLAAISTIYNSVQKDKKTQENEYFSLGADDFLPIFLHVLVQCGMVSAEVEADYMWGLLHPSLLTGEGGYYLTTLSSAVHVLKNLGGGASSPASSQNTPAPPSLTSSTTSASSGGSSATSSTPAVRVGDCKWTKEQAPVELRYPRVADLQGFMQIVIPDELSGSILSKTLPVMPNMITKEVCKMIAHKFKVTNPEDYGLFKLVKGEETQLGDNECPQTIKADLLTSGIECRFAYKRCDIKFVWPFAEKPA